MKSLRKFQMNKSFLYMEYIDHKKSIHTIAKQNNVNYSFIRRRLIKHGFRIRSRLEAGGLRGSHNGDFKKGNIPWNKGKPCPLGVRKKISDAEKGTGIGKENSMWGKFGKNHPAWGNKHTEQTKEKISLTHKGKPKSEEHKKKMSFNATGAKHPNWKGGASPERSRLWSKKEYREWRIAVYKRDGYKCLIKKGCEGRLNAHHVLSFTEYPKHRFDVNNGQTLCKKHHCSVHRKTLWLGIYNSAFGLGG